MRLRLRAVPQERTPARHGDACHHEVDRAAIAEQDVRADRESFGEHDAARDQRGPSCELVGH